MRNGWIAFFVVIIGSVSLWGIDSIELDQELESMMEQYHMPGLAATIVKGDSVLWKNYYGYADMEEERLVTDSTTFMIASISKTVVGTALMQLWEDQIFNLDDDINQYLDFNLVNHNFPESVITFRMLMTHTSSIQGDFEDGGINAPNFTWGVDHPMSIGDFLKDHFTPGGTYYDPSNFNNFEPGTQFDYSSVGTTLCAYLVERISGETFENYCQNKIFLPLGMDDTSWFLSGINRSNHASHYWYEDGQYTKYPPRGTPLYPCGWLKINLDNLTKYMITYIDGGVYNGVRLLESDTIDDILTVQDPNMSNYMGSKDWGLKWYQYERGVRTLWGHEGGSLGVTTLLYFDKVSDIGVLMISNGSNFSSLVNTFSELFDYGEEIIASVDDIRLPDNINLSSYPNPFNPETTIRYSLDSNSQIELLFYNVNGELISRRDLGVKMGGEHQFRFDGEGLNSGIYFCRIMVDGIYSSTLKLNLIK